MFIRDSRNQTRSLSIAISIESILIFIDAIRVQWIHFNWSITCELMNRQIEFTASSHIWFVFAWFFDELNTLKNELIFIDAMRVQRNHFDLSITCESIESVNWTHSSFSFHSFFLDFSMSQWIHWKSIWYSTSWAYLFDHWSFIFAENEWSNKSNFNFRMNLNICTRASISKERIRYMKFNENSDDSKRHSCQTSTHFMHIESIISRSIIFVSKWNLLRKRWQSMSQTE
jgi:hypothetical protein